ncbi:hypothetical protein TYRP_013157 [Tyrophagus putrescentiae]|nr:hypothetical protein TYRP_013157 [Tyrophagus putrescentiae]
MTVIGGHLGNGQMAVDRNAWLLVYCHVGGGDCGGEGVTIMISNEQCSKRAQHLSFFDEQQQQQQHT